MSLQILSLLGLLTLLPALGNAASATRVQELRCEYTANPVGIDNLHPQLSWIIASDRRNTRQTAYRVLVASAPELLARDIGNLWDSGVVVSDESTHVVYGGIPLKREMRCYWKVCVWDNSQGRSAWSRAASWSMGLLHPEDWSAKWITASRWFVPQSLRPRGLELKGAGWADVDLGKAYRIDSIKLTPYSIKSFPKRFKIEGADEPYFLAPNVLIDKTAGDYAPTGTDAQEYPVGGARYRYIRLAVMDTGSATAVRQMEVISLGRNVALMRPTKEQGTEWDHGHAPFLVDGMPNHGDGDNCPADACPITQAPLFRKAFFARKQVKRATLFIAALGMANVSVNGKRVSDDLLGPPFSDYTKRVFYVTRDITPLVNTGENVIGATLGNGYFSTPGMGFGQRQSGNGPPRLLIQAKIEFADGTSKTLGTDKTWKWSPGPITYNDLWDGYKEDRHFAQPGWDKPRFSEAGWRSASLSAAPEGTLRAPIGPPVRIVGEMKPSRVDGNHAYFDVLSAGWPRLTVNGKAGQTISLRGKGMGFSLPELTFTLAADGPAILQPDFIILSGPTDLEIDGLTQPLTKEMICIEQVGADLRPTGSFSCSNPFLNKVYAAVVQTNRNYVTDFPADPTREKQGWSQDAQNMYDAASYISDTAGMYRKWWWDMADNQDSSGYLGSVIPVVGRQVYDWNSPWWSGVVVLVPWKQYEYYGDKRILAEAYEPMRRYVDFLGRMAVNGIGKIWYGYPYPNLNVDTEAAKDRMIIWNGAGDWHNPYTSTQFAVPAPMTTMPAYYYFATIVSRTASLLGKKSASAKYASIAHDVKDRFNAAYFHPATGLYGDEAGNQTAQVLPLALGLVPDDKRSLAYERLLDAIHARGDHIGCGFVGLPFLLQILTEARETALSNKMVNQQSYPSWSTLMHDGVLGEDWRGGGAQMPSTGGSIAMWMYQSILGIRPDPAGPGYMKFIIAPQPDPGTGLTSAQGYYDSIHGRIAGSWRVSGGIFKLDVTIPANTSATVWIPTSDNRSVLESGKKPSKEMALIGSKTGAAVYRVGSGTYRFSAKFH